MVDNKSFNLVIVKPRRLTKLFSRLKVLVNSKYLTFKIGSGGPKFTLREIMLDIILILIGRALCSYR